MVATAKIFGFKYLYKTLRLPRTLPNEATLSIGSLKPYATIFSLVGKVLEYKKSICGFFSSLMYNL
jgi:hypothetical protein